ncbi:lytic transglycosylase domain-containing protein [Eubacteriales bacterium OttesenSCG-928-M02]|nr:lytic transglycosylase domain-containing protein [Eubacteriales bacterium OttesenSCG-928-M02]
MATNKKTPQGNGQFARQKMSSIRPQHARESARRKAFRFFGTSGLVLVLSFVILFSSVWVAGSGLSEGRIFPHGTIVNGHNIGGLSFADGVDAVLAESFSSANMDIQFLHNGSYVFLTTEELGIRACVEELLEKLCYAPEKQGLTGVIDAIFHPKKGLNIDASAILDKGRVESAILETLANDELMASASGSLTAPAEGNAQLLHLDYTLGEEGRAIATIQVDVELLSQKAYSNTQVIQYRNIIERYARQYQLDPAFITATIFVESSFRNTIESAAGAIGLMQVMPTVATWIAGEIKLENYRVEMLLEPEINIQMGCWYLAYLMDRYDGDRITVLAAYNAGPTKVDEWLRDSRFSQDGKKLDTVPWDETRVHGERIEVYYEVYKEIYAKEQ